MNNLIEPPDFDDMLRVAQLVGRLTAETQDLDIEIKSREVDIVKEVTTNKDYFRDGKPLAQNAIEATYKYSGLQGELIPLRKQLAQKKGELETAKLTFDAMKGQIQVFQTQSSNIRGAIV